MGKSVLQRLHNFRCGRASEILGAREKRSDNLRQRRVKGWIHVDVVTIAVLGVILVSYVVGSLTSSIETEQKLPHRY
jgi:hypothetical protein